MKQKVKVKVCKICPQGSSRSSACLEDYITGQGYKENCTRNSAIAVIADHRLKQLLHDIYFNAIHCDCSISTCE